MVPRIINKFIYVHALPIVKPSLLVGRRTVGACWRVPQVGLFTLSCVPLTHSCALSIDIYYLLHNFGVSVFHEENKGCRPASAVRESRSGMLPWRQRDADFKAETVI
jgi:hypothetical protein